MNVDTAKLRQFINKHFGPEDLRTFLFDYFRSVYDDLTDGLTKSRQIALLLEYCHKYKKFPDLLAAIQRERPFFQPDDYVQGEKAPTATPQPPASITRNPRQIFISHAHQDAEVAQRLAHDLEAHGYDIWIAMESIRPGEKWAEAIDRGLEESGIFIVLLSPDAMASDWVKRETYAAIEFEDGGEMQIFPLVLKKCRLPASWRSFHHISLRNGYEIALMELLAVLSSREGTNGQILFLPKEDVQKVSKTQQKSSIYEMDQAFLLALAQSISPGLKVAYDDEIAILLNKNIDAVRTYLTFLANNEFINLNKNVRSPSGISWAVRLTNSGENLLKPFQEKLEVKVVTHSDHWTHPKSGLEMIRIPASEFLYGDGKKKLYLDEFWMAKTPVTNLEYARFISETKSIAPSHWQNKIPPIELASHPVTHISWYEAKAYTKWASLVLPTEQQWEKAARGTDGRNYPWGNDWRKNFC
ncbi:MAG: TIR domain-containing protein, partial [Anaerolineales bacterium]|nr:TIR domain-containing protein [Anaerolineales bacterium]